MKEYLWRLLIAGVIAATILGACAPAQPAAEQIVVTQTVKETVLVEGTPQLVERIITPTPVREPPTVVFAQGVDATFLQPNIDGSGAQVNIHLSTHDTLFHYNAQGELVPRLAESVDIPDPTTYVFHIRQGVKFHDGTELTSKDVKFTFEQCYLHQDTLLQMGVCYWGPFIETINLIDDYTLELKLNAPNAVLLSRLTQLYIVPEDAVRELGPEGYNENPIGTGPFKFVEWVKDLRLVLEANEEYWDGPPQIGRLIIRPIPEAATRLAALRNGEVDVIVNVPPDSIPILENDPNTHVKISDAGRLIFITLNPSAPPFDDVLVRQAVNHAVDWNAIIENVLGGLGYPTPCPITPNDFPSDALEDICAEKAYAYDPEKAQELLAEAGYPNGFDLVLEGPDGRYLKDAEVLQAVGGYLEQVGIRTTVQPQEWGIYYQERYNGQKVAAGLFGMGNPLFDIDHLMAVHFDPDRRSLYYSTPRLKELIDAGNSTPYPDERIEYYREAMNIIMDDAPWIFGYGMMNIIGLSNRVDWEPHPGREDIWFAEFEVIEP